MGQRRLTPPWFLAEVDVLCRPTAAMAAIRSLKSPGRVKAGQDSVDQLIRPAIAAKVGELGVAQAGVRLIIQEDKGGIRKPRHNHTLLDLLSKWMYKQYKEPGGL